MERRLSVVVAVFIVFRFCFRLLAICLTELNEEEDEEEEVEEEEDEEGEGRRMTWNRRLS